MSENHHRLPLVLNLAPYLAPESFGWRYVLHSLFCPGFKSRNLPLSDTYFLLLSKGENKPNGGISLPSFRGDASQVHSFTARWSPAAGGSGHLPGPPGPQQGGAGGGGAGGAGGGGSGGAGGQQLRPDGCDGLHLQRTGEAGLLKQR